MGRRRSVFGPSCVFRRFCARIMAAWIRTSFITRFLPRQTSASRRTSRSCARPTPKRVAPSKRGKCPSVPWWYTMAALSRDPSGHAEFSAMRAAAQALGRWRLSGCTVYVTVEPCIMCAGLMHQARIDRCVWGAPDPKAGALGSLYAIHADERLNHRFESTGGVWATQCGSLMRDFFACRRDASDQGDADA